MDVINVALLANGACSKCSGERPFCETCTKRGFSHTCFYLRQTVQMPSTSNSDEVLQKLNRIESLLERQGDLLERGLDAGPRSYPSHADTHSQRQPSSLNSSPWTEADASQIGHPDISDAPPVGTVLMYGGGYERFVPGIASADADAVNELIQSSSTPALSTNFPFTDESRASRQALLETLPPFPQCDELKDIFFEVFSPVCNLCITSIAAYISSCLSPKAKIRLVRGRLR